jgi:uncharacterized delta-60 repeat protein
MNPTTRAAAAALALAGCLATPAPAHAAAGDLDTSFDGDGQVGVDFGGTEQAAAVARQPDGKLVVVGQTSVDGDIAVARLNPDSKIVVVGSSYPGGDIVVTRLNADGSLDATFDGDGRRTIGFGGYDNAGAVLVQGDVRCERARAWLRRRPAITDGHPRRVRVIPDPAADHRRDRPVALTRRIVPFNSPAQAKPPSGDGAPRSASGRITPMPTQVLEMFLQGRCGESAPWTGSR